MGTQLSHRCKTSLYRLMSGHAQDKSIVFLDRRRNLWVN
jgi:hypothetical protein